jgi:hypothetical protein
MMAAQVFCIAIGLGFFLAACRRLAEPKTNNLTRGEKMYPEDK